MADKEGSPKKDDGAGGSSKPAPVGGDSSPVSTDPVENLALQNPDTVLQDVPGDAAVAEQGKGSGSAPSTGSAAADKGGEVGQGSHGKGKEVVVAQSSAVPEDVSALDGKGGDGGASIKDRMNALVAGLPHFPPAQGPPQAPLVLEKGKAKRTSDGQGSRTGSKKTKGPLFQSGAELCLACHLGPATTSLFAGHDCICLPCRLIIQANPMSTPCQVCLALMMAPPPKQ